MFKANAVANVGPVKTHHKAGGILELQARRNLEPGLLVGGGGERNARYVGELLVQQTQLQVISPKIMAPLRHAVRLVNRKQCDLTAFE